MNNPFMNPLIIENLKIDGVAENSSAIGEMCNITVRKFISSKESEFSKFADNLMNFVDVTNLNQLLVIIKPDNKAYVYRLFEYNMTIILTSDKLEGEPVFEKDIADLTKISFKNPLSTNSTPDINPEKGDKVIWLFRIKWEFGLFFDYSGELDINQFQTMFAYYYKKIYYSSKYDFLSNKNNFNELVKDGWFPFIGLPENLFFNIITYYNEKKKYYFHIENVLDYFNEIEIRKIVNRWWRNQIFLDKKEIILAGIDAFLGNSKAGYINCIKNLIGEFEGIIRYAMFKASGNRRPVYQNIREFLLSEGSKKFSSEASLGFPKEFDSYLKNSVYKDFDITNDSNSSSHSVRHGVADTEIFTRARALQIILTIDQTFFYLSKP
jgi:hypothetical protein